MVGVGTHEGPLIPAAAALIDAATGGVPDIDVAMTGAMSELLYFDVNKKDPPVLEILGYFNSLDSMPTLCAELIDKKKDLEDHLADSVGHRTMVLTFSEAALRTDYFDKPSLKAVMVQGDALQGSLTKSRDTTLLSKHLHRVGGLIKENWNASVEWRAIQSSLGGSKSLSATDSAHHATYRQNAHVGPVNTAHPDGIYPGATVAFVDIGKVDGGRKAVNKVWRYMHSVMPGSIPMKVYKSGAADTDIINVQSEYPELLPLNCFKVERDMAVGLFEVNLNVDARTIDRGVHVLDRLGRLGITVTLDNILDAVLEARTGRITSGKVITSAAWMRNRVSQNVPRGARELLLACNTYVSGTNTNTKERIRFPAKVVVVATETALFEGTINAVATFVVTIIPEQLPDGLIRLTGMPPNPFVDSVDALTSLVMPLGYDPESPEILNAMTTESLVRRGLNNTDGRTGLMITRPEGHSPIALSVEPEDAERMSGLFQEACYLVLKSYLQARLPRVDLFVALNWLNGRIGPFIGPNERIWHPTLTFGGLHRFDLKLLATRWMLSYLCFFGVYNSRNLDVMPDVHRILNHKQALLAGVPASITEKFFIAYAVSPSALSLFTNNAVGVGQRPEGLKGGLEKLVGRITNSKHGRVLPTSGFSFDFICTVHSAPFRLDALPTNRSGEPRFYSRNIVVRPDGSLESWDFVLHDLAARLIRLHNKRGDGLDINAMIWTPDVMLVVSLEGTVTRANPTITAYLHTGGRASRLVPTRHDPKQVVTREGETNKISASLLNDTGGTGYMKSFVENRELLLAAMRK